jgi:threonine/homoserine/homoserine lactone efflux protein
VEYLIYGLTLGLGSGISPGPLMALVIAASLRSGLRGGLQVAVAPLLTDVPIVALALLVISRLPDQALRWIGIVGGLVVAWLGIELLRSGRTAELPPSDIGTSQPELELLRGVLVNFTNPHPYLFWISVGAPTVLDAWSKSPWQAAAFVGGFYVLLVGIKMVLAWALSQAQTVLSTRGYRTALVVSGCAMLVLAGNLLWQGIQG